MDLDDHTYDENGEGSWTLNIYLYGYESMEDANLTIRWHSANTAADYSATADPVCPNGGYNADDDDCAANGLVLEGSTSGKYLMHTT